MQRGLRVQRALAALEERALRGGARSFVLLHRARSHLRVIGRAPNERAEKEGGESPHRPRIARPPLHCARRTPRRRCCGRAVRPTLMTTLRRLNVGRLLDPLPDRLALAHQQKMAHHEAAFVGQRSVRIVHQGLRKRVERGEQAPTLR